MIGLNKEALDRHITGNWGEDQFKQERDFCIGPHDLVFVGDEPNDYDYPETGTHPVYACRFCGDLYDSRYCKRELRGGEECGLDLNHRGNCSSIVFHCDGCGRMRRGQPYFVAQTLMPDGYREPIADFCFVCTETDWRPIRGR